MLAPGEMVQVLSPDSTLVMDRIIVGQWPLVLAVTHTGQLAAMQP